MVFYNKYVILFLVYTQNASLWFFLIKLFCFTLFRFVMSDFHSILLFLVMSLWFVVTFGMKYLVLTFHNKSYSLCLTWFVMLHYGIEQ